jgi:hypothetical protein
MPEYPEETWIGDSFIQLSADISKLNIGHSEISYSLGYKDGRIPDPFDGMIVEIVAALPEKCTLSAGYTVLPVDLSCDDSQSIRINGIRFIVNKMVKSQLQKSERAALFLCSIGPGMETWSRDLIQQGDPALALFVDTVASFAVEKLAGVLHDHIKRKMHLENLSLTNRYSPGYCNWNVGEQHKLFSLFPKNIFGVTLTESAMMFPIKSISGIIGIGTAVKYRDYLCDTCTIQDCIYGRRKTAVNT